jgi:hypothetical protein
LLAGFRRWRLGLPLFGPYGKHLDQRLLQAGVSRENLARGTYALTAIFLILALVAFCWRGQSLPVVIGGTTLSLLWLASRFTSSQDWFSGRAKSEDLQARIDIQYALAQSDWLGMEGARGRSLDSICADTAWIAGKLGFTRLRIHLEDNEKVWQLIPSESTYTRETHSETEDFQVLTGAGGARCHLFRHRLPWNPSCCLELQTPNLAGIASNSAQPSKLKGKSSRFEIISQVLADGWARSLTDWRQKNGKQAIRF